MCLPRRDGHFFKMQITLETKIGESGIPEKSHHHVLNITSSGIPLSQIILFRVISILKKRPPRPGGHIGHKPKLEAIPRYGGLEAGS